MEDTQRAMEEMRGRYADKFAREESIFEHIRRGVHLFIGTGCGEPQHLVDSLAAYAACNPKAVCDAEVFQVWTLGVAPYAQERFSRNFRHNSFFIGDNTRQAVNQGLADYTPIFLSQVPDLFYRGYIPVDVALVQTSPPDRNGYMSLGMQTMATGGVAWFAHIGGFVMGLLAGFVLRKTRLRPPRIEPPYSMQRRPPWR